jgi:hypothetical protein
VKNVVKKFIRFIPEPDAAAAGVIHRRGDPKKMFEELGRDIFVNRILARQLERGSHHS